MGETGFLRAARILLFPIVFVSIPSGLGAAALAYVVNNSSNTVTVFDLQKNAVINTIPVGSGPTEISFDSGNQKAYVPNEGSNSVSVIDLESQAITATVGVGVGPVSLLLSQNSRYCYVVNGGSNNLTAFDTTDHSVLRTIPVGTTPVSVNISSNGLYLFVTNQDSNDISVISTADLSVLATIQVGTRPNQAGLTPNNRTILAVNTGSDSISMIDMTTLSVSRTVPVGRNPVGLAVSLDSQFAFVTNRGSNTVSKIDLAQGKVVQTFDVGLSPVGIALTGDGRFAYVSNSGSGNVTVFDTLSPANTDVIPVGQSPFSILFDPEENNVYVTNLGSNSVSVISTNSDTVIKTVPVGTSPVQFALLNSPTLLAISQDLGGKAGGTRLQIIGSGFVDGATVDFGGSLATIESFSPYALRVVTGSHSSAQVSVTLTNPDQSSDTLPLSFNYVDGSVSYQAVFPSSLDTAAYRTNLGVNNLTATDGSATVALTNIGGSVMGSQSVGLPANGLNQISNVNRTLVGSSQISNTSGSLVVNSSLPIWGFVSIIDNISLDPSIEIAVRSGASQLLIPSVTNTGAFRSNLVIKNLSSFEGDITLSARDTGGRMIAQRNSLKIPANGSLEIEDVLTFLGVSGNFGPLEILSSNQALCVATSRVFASLPDGGTNGGFLEAQRISQAATSLYVPFVIDTAAFRTNLGLNNPGSTEARVTILFLDNGGRIQASGVTRVPSAGMIQINAILRKILNNPSQLDLSVVQDSGVPVNQEGYLQIVSSLPVVAWASQIDNATNDPSLEIGQRQGFTKLLLSSTTNVGSFRSTLSILNTQSVDAIIDLISRSTNGDIQGSRRIAIPPNGLFTENDILSSMNLSGAFGPLEIDVTNGIPVVAISRVYSVNGTSAFFESRPLD